MAHFVASLYGFVSVKSNSGSILPHLEYLSGSERFGSFGHFGHFGGLKEKHLQVDLERPSEQSWV